jgi:hypothetical protein
MQPETMETTGNSISAAEDAVWTASNFGVTADTARLITVQAIATGVAEPESRFLKSSSRRFCE